MSVIRRIVTVMLLLALGLGTPVFEAQAGDMTAMAATDQPTPGHCDLCGGDEMGMTASACFAVCSGVQAADWPAAFPSLFRSEAYHPLPEHPLSSSLGAPDPFPPRLNILV